MCKKIFTIQMQPLANLKNRTNFRVIYLMEK
ncbi:MAG: hypothetical protein RL757_1617 [Bacteroidota bacterium]|jgi:hypothetical protein